MPVRKKYLVSSAPAWLINYVDFRPPPDMTQMKGEMGTFG